MAEAKQPSTSSNTTPEDQSGERTSTEQFSSFPVGKVDEAFKHLSLTEDPRNRPVSKQFHKTAEVSRDIDCELVVKPYETVEVDEVPGYHCNHRWYHTADYADPTAFVPTLPAVEHLKKLFNHLRRLRIATPRFKVSILPLLSCPHLTHLEIEQLSFDLDEPLTLQQPDLEVLYIRSVRLVSGRQADSYLMFESPKLAVLCLGDRNANRHIVVSHPERVTFFESDQLPYHDMLDDARQFAYRSLETVVCTDLIELANNQPTLDALIELNSLKEFHLFTKEAGGFRRLNAWPGAKTYSDQMYTLQTMQVLGQYILEQRRLRRRDPLLVWMQGVTLSRVLDGVKGVCTLDRASMLQLHFRNRDRLPASFPHCFSLHFDWPFLFELGPALAGKRPLDFRSIYPFVKELRIALSCLVPKLLLKIRDLCETDRRPERFRPLFDRRSELFETLVELHPAPADQLPLRPGQDPRDLAQDFHDIDERGPVPFDRPVDRQDQVAKQMASDYRRAVLDHLRTRESAMNERAESGVLKFIENFEHLAYLNLTFNGLSQSFYDRLAERSVLTTSVNKLVLFEDEHNAITDLNFLLAFKRLYWFESNLFPRRSLREQPIIDFLLVLNNPAQCRLHLTEPAELITIEKYQHQSKTVLELKTRFTVRRLLGPEPRKKTKLRLKRLKETLALAS